MPTQGLPESRELVVFARNEASFIAQCVESIAQSDALPGLKVTVVVNGCSDETPDIVRTLCTQYDWLRLVEIAFPDKANAWNVFVHEIARPDTEVCYFMDGDCQVAPHSLASLGLALTSNPASLVVSAVPARQFLSAGSYRRQMLSIGGVAGNLYAMRTSFLLRIRNAGVRMPIGWIGDDGLVGLLAASDLQPQTEWDPVRTLVCPEAVFFYEPVVRILWRDPMVYWRRKLRYSLRHFQNRLIGMRLQRDGLNAMPGDVTTLYEQESPAGLKLRWSLRTLWFDWRARGIIRALHAKRAE